MDSSTRPQAPPKGKAAGALRYARDYISEHRYPPTVREISRAVGLRSPSSAKHHLDKLEEAGWISRDGSNPRTLRVLHDPDA